MTQNDQELIEETKKLLVKTYPTQPVVMDHGEGVYAYDTNGKKYLDFAIGIAVASLGHAHPAMLEAINSQAAKLITCQGSYATYPKLACSKLLIENGCFDLVSFFNSGTEAVEASLKLSRKWAYDNKGKNCNEIISFRNSFHGRTYGTASITEKSLSQPFFKPYVPNIHFANFNDIDSVKALINDNTASIIIEPIQCESGIIIAKTEFMKELRNLCNENDIILIFDEVQTAMGRLGTLYAYENFGTEPDIACLAKGIAGGFPVSAMVTKKHIGDAFVPGTHGSTYGGNPLAMAVATAVISELLKDGFLENVKETGKYFVNSLKQLQKDSGKITDIRSMGLMIGIDTSIEIKPLLSALQGNGLMATQAGDFTLRLTPPLIVTKSHIDEAIEIIGKTLKEKK
ncbi:MAG: aspartate aminotransferase family protein [Alphaproteobacteria bacterium]|nr:aspartate aminotransferase family protein [Alphaproteobacteria bacterium]